MRLAAATLLSALLVLGAGSAQAVPGNLDPSFGSGGVATIRIGGSASAQGVVLQPDGKIVEAGWSLDGSDGVFALARFGADGSLDTQFGSKGTTTTAWGTHSQARGLALQPDGKIVVAGQIFYQAKFALARYRPDGSLDPSFAADGKQTFPIGEASGAAAVAVQPDGKIVVAGFSSSDTSSAVALARLKPNGLPDPGFGTDGITTTAIGTHSAAEALVLQPDGKLVVAGFSAVGGGFTRATLARYGVGGALDDGFGSGGIATLAGSPNNADAHALALQPDGKIVVAGNDSGRGLLLARYAANGTLDQGFGAGGRVLTRRDGNSEATGVALQPDGKIVVAGRTRDGPVSTYAVARYDATGSLDLSFGRGGVVVTRLAPLPKVASGTAAGVVLQADGKIVVGGTIQQLTGAAGPTFGLARYLVTPGCRVPDIRGRLLARGKATLVSAGCSVGAVTRGFSKKVKRGRVISERPGPGSGLPELAKVRLVVSKGRPPKR
jgi:uncharacterized delta-60 repeat protein